MYTEIPIIIAIVAFLLEVYKSVFKGNENMIKFIPIIGSVLGMILGIVAYYTTPEIVVSNNVFIAMLHGSVSGFAATGAHQAYKQLSKKAENKTEDIENNINNDTEGERKQTKKENEDANKD